MTPFKYYIFKMIRYRNLEKISLQNKIVLYYYCLLSYHSEFQRSKLLLYTFKFCKFCFKFERKQKQKILYNR